MNKQQYLDKINKLQNELLNIETKFKSLKVGELIYEPDIQDPFGAYFKHEVISVDLEELIVNTLDHSRDFLPCKLSYWEFKTAKEAGF